ncbi:MAG: hypothetical protein IAE80_21930 [Anaerolinea sp.]|nr:hypothetical protein [Anaerolinea sp.]
MHCTTTLTSAPSRSSNIIRSSQPSERASFFQPDQLGRQAANLDVEFVFFLFVRRFFRCPVVFLRPTEQAGHPCQRLVTPLAD